MGARVVVDQVAAAADTRDVGVGHAERGGDRDRGVGGCSAVAQHVQAGLRRLRGVRDHRAAVALRHRCLSVLVDRRSLHRGHRCGDQTRTEQQPRGKCGSESTCSHAQPQ